MAGSHDLRTPDHEPEFTFFYPFFSDRSRLGHTIRGSARGVSGVFGVSSVLCYTGVWFCLLGLLSVSSTGFRSVSVSSPVFLYLWLIHRRIRGTQVWFSCWMDGMTTSVRNLRCCVACHFALPLGSGRFSCGVKIRERLVTVAIF